MSRLSLFAAQHHMPEKEKIIFSSRIELIGINPFVFLPENILQAICKQAGKYKGKIPITVAIDGHTFTQTLVKYSGHWRLYLNAPMRKAAGKQVGAIAQFEVAYDPEPRHISMHPKLQQAFIDHTDAKAIFDRLAPSLQLEIVRYIAHLKTDASVDRNVERAILFLQGKERFIGRAHPPTAK